MQWLETRFPPPLLAMFAGGLMWALTRWAPVLIWIQPPRTQFAFLPAILALTIFLAAAGKFRRAKTTIDPVNPDNASTLVTTGIFSVTRNPMYIALSLLLCGVAIRLGSISAWIIVPLFVVYISRFQIAPEERMLLAKFGDPYARYTRAVPRWLLKNKAPS